MSLSISKLRGYNGADKISTIQSNMIQKYRVSVRGKEDEIEEIALYEPPLNSSLNRDNTIIESEEFAELSNNYEATEFKANQYMGTDISNASTNKYRLSKPLSQQPQFVFN